MRSRDMNASWGISTFPTRFILFLPVAVPVVLLYGIGKKISGAMHGRRPATFNERPGGAR